MSYPNTIRIEGQEAIVYARANGATLSKYTDPTEEGRDGLTIEEAEEVAREDASLIYIDVPSAKQAMTPHVLAYIARCHAEQAKADAAAYAAGEIMGAALVQVEPTAEEAADVAAWRAATSRAHRDSETA